MNGVGQGVKFWVVLDGNVVKEKLQYIIVNVTVSKSIGRIGGDTKI